MATKIKIFNLCSEFEETINDFIKDKKVINILQSECNETTTITVVYDDLKTGGI